MFKNLRAAELILSWSLQRHYSPYVTRAVVISRLELRLEDLLPKWLMQIACKLLLIISKKSKFFVTWTFPLGFLGYPQNIVVGSPKASDAKGNKTEATLSFITSHQKPYIYLSTISYFCKGQHYSMFKGKIRT